MHACTTAPSSWGEREWTQALCVLDKQPIIWDHIVNPEVQIYSKFLTFFYRFASKFCHWTLRRLHLSLLCPWSLPCPCLAFPFSTEKLCCALKSSLHGHVSLWALWTLSHQVKRPDCTNTVPSSKIYHIHCKGGNWNFILQFHLLKPCNRQKLLSNCNWLDEMMTIAFPLPCE